VEGGKGSVAERGTGGVGGDGGGGEGGGGGTLSAFASLVFLLPERPLFLLDFFEA
jgi:hypothetical protein